MNQLGYHRTQQDVVVDVLLSATEANTWLTIKELADLTSFPIGSVRRYTEEIRKVTRFRMESRWQDSKGPAWHGVKEYSLTRRLTL